MRNILRLLLLTALVAASLLTIATPAEAAVINVTPGQSIQAAINRANPGDTINVAAGTYREALTIRKDNLKLIGAGDGPTGTVLRPPASATGFCAEGESFPGICVIAKQFDENFNVVTPVKGVQVRNFLVKGFPGDGIVTFGADSSTFFNNTAAANQGYGITSFVSTGNVFNQLVARYNVAPGFYIGDSPNADFVLKNSQAFGNGLGLLIREANNGQITNNRFHDNCAGIFIENHGNEPALDIRVQDWLINKNRVNYNNKLCQDEHGTIGGVGIVLNGPRNVVVEDNQVNGNQAPAGSPFGGGILLASSESAGGNPPVGNTIRRNTALENKPFDIFWDGTGSNNTFPNNTCEKSQPAFICA